MDHIKSNKGQNHFHLKFLKWEKIKNFKVQNKLKITIQIYKNFQIF